MIIDSLVHVTHDGLWFDTKHDASVDRLLHEMDKAFVDKSVVVALSGYIDNDFVSKICRKHSDRLIPGASINPASYSSAKNAGIAMRNLLEDENFSVLKLHPRLNGYDPLDSRCLAVLEELAASSSPMPVWLDTLFRSKKCVLQKDPVDTIHELIQRYSDVQFVLLHSCGAQVLQVAEIVGQFSNVTLDLSLTLLYYAETSVEKDLQFLLSRRDQVTITGSDFPEYTPKEYIDKMNEYKLRMNLPEDKYNNVMWKNINQILKLS